MNPGPCTSPTATSVIVTDESVLRRILAEELQRLLDPIAAMLQEIASSPHPERSPGMLTRQQTAVMLGVDLRSLRRRELEGTVPPAIRIGKSVRWSREVLADFMKTGRVDSPPKALSIPPKRRSL